MKKLVLVLMVLLLAVGVVFAGGKSDSSKGSGKIVMGALIRNLNETFVRDYADNLQKLATANNVELKVMDGNGDVATQLDHLNTLLSIS